MNVATINIKFLSKFGEGLVYIPYKNWKTCPKQNWLKIGYYSWRYFHLKSHEIDLWDLLNILSFEIVFKKNFVKSICASWRARASFLSLKLFLRKFYEIDFYATFCCEFDFTEKFVKSIFSNACYSIRVNFNAKWTLLWTNFELYANWFHGKIAEKIRVNFLGFLVSSLRCTFTAFALTLSVSLVYYIAVTVLSSWQFLIFFLLSYPRKIHDGMAISVIIGRNMGTLHKSKSRGMALVLIDSSINECNAMNKSLTCTRTSRA